jgi:hypothetical protein
MTSVTLGHSLVRGYLDELDAAFAALAPEQARELREQIVAHLEDALPAGAGDQEVADVLRRLGRPVDLAAEAAEQAGSAESGKPSVREISPGQARRRRPWQPPRLAWPVSALIAAVVAGVGYLIAVQTAPALQPAGSSGWWYTVDAGRSTWTAEPTGEMVNSTPIRPGQLQGFIITIINNSDWTQTVLGPAADFIAPGGHTGIRIAVTRYDRNIERGGLTRSGLSFTLPGSIPPHQIRALRLVWRTTICQVKGSGTLVNQLRLRVRIGGVTRTEAVTLDDYWTLTGASPRANSHGYCV